MFRKYLLIITILLACVVLFVGCASRGSDSADNIISGAEAREMYESYDTVILLDVRSQAEFNVNHIEGSILIPHTELEGRLSELPGRDTIIIVFCRAGARSATAAEILIENGFTNVYDMQRIDNW